MSNSGIVTIHGKEYMTVARRIELAHEEKALEGIETEILSHNPIVIRAKVYIKGKLYTGISSVNPENARTIERENPYEVAETSAVGRALGFAGYGLIESVASADEMTRSLSVKVPQPGNMQEKLPVVSDKKATNTLICDVCGQPAVEKRGTTKSGKKYHGIFCTTEDRSHTRWLWN